MPADRRIAEAVAAIEARHAASAQRPFVVGIAGPPAAGKTTLSEAVAAELARTEGRTVLALQMDGFHLSDDELRRRGIHAFKGREDTFDAKGLTDSLARLRAGETGFHWPVFLREIEASVAEGIPIETRSDIAVLEGNYLLLDRGAWSRIRPMLDVAIFIDAPEDELVARLVARHMANGRMQGEALTKIEGTDLPNMRVIRATAARADLLLDAPPGGRDA